MFPTFFAGKVQIVSRTLSGLFPVGALNRPRKRKRANRENPRNILEQIGKIQTEKDKKGSTSPDRETPPFETPPSRWTFRPKKKYLAPPPANSPIHRRHLPGPLGPSRPGGPPPPGIFNSKLIDPSPVSSNSPFPLPEQKKNKKYPKRPPCHLAALDDCVGWPKIRLLNRDLTLRAQILKIFKILKFSSEIEIFKRATHQPSIFCGEF